MDRAEHTAPPIIVRACDRLFTVAATCARTSLLLQSVFSALVVRPAASGRLAVRCFTVEGPDALGQFVVGDGTGSWRADGPADLIYQIDKQITLALQRERPELFFAHAAAVAMNGGVVALPAFPGTGKSTFTLALAQRGFDYLSDELAPVELGTMMIEPYPHSVCLKSVPPAACVLPEGTLRLGTRLHVPVDSLATCVRTEPLPLHAIIFLRRDGSAATALRRLTAASAATYLMAHLLNGLAHPHFGLDAAISISRAVPCFELDVSDLTGATAHVAALCSTS